MPAARRQRKRPIDRADEPRPYDRRLYPWVLLAAAVLILVTTGFVVWRVAFNTTTRPSGGLYDTSSIFHEPRGFPDPDNPCMVLQKNLVASRNGDDRRAYGYLSKGLQAEVPYERFVENNGSNRHLFDDVRAYRFPSCEVNATAASVKGYIDYKTGGSSEVQAEFAWQDGQWKIARITVIFK
jgi:hypothetical protein